MARSSDRCSPRSSATRELTPYHGGWAGNEVFSGAFSEAVRAKARAYAERIGDQLLAEGYRGYFDLDFLIDRATASVYLGELNPRICGASPLTNHAAFAHADVPLFLFHLLEFSGVEFDLDIDELNARWADPRFIDSWSAVVLKSTTPEVDRVTRRAVVGSVALHDGRRRRYRRFDYRRGAIESRVRRPLPAHHGPGRLALRGRRSRHPDHAWPAHDRRLRA